MIRNTSIPFLLLLIPISACILSVEAQTPDLSSLMDTGTQDTFEDDYRLYWPEKIIMTSKINENSKIKMSLKIKMNLMKKKFKNMKK